MDVEEFRKAGYEAIDRICDYFYSLQDRPVWPDVKPGYLIDAIPTSAPEKGEDFQTIADDYQKLIIPGLMHWQHPSFYGYYTTATTFEGILGDLYASSTSNPGFNWSASPACTELEIIVMDWAVKMLGLSPDFLCSSGHGGGCIQGSASDSALVGIVAARAAYMIAHPEARLDQLVIYVTTQTHSLGTKAGLVLGLEVRTLEVTAEDKFSLRGETLRQALEEDTAVEKRPFVLVATIGTTSSGAIDNLVEIKHVIKDYPDLKVHVDAAWAGIALCCPEYRDMLYLKEVNEIADSFCTNFHKWGLVNFDASAIWVKDRQYLTEALSVTPPFLRTAQGDAGTVIDYRNWGLALGRRFRSAKMWFVLRSFGIEGFQKHIRKHVMLNEVFAKLVNESSLLTLVTPPSLALSVFRMDPSSMKLSSEELNSLNQALYKRISARQDIFLTQTTLNGVYCIRMAIGATRTTEKHIKDAFNLITEESELTLRDSGIVH